VVRPLEGGSARGAAPVVSRDAGIVVAVDGRSVEIRDAAGQIWLAHRHGAALAPGDRVVFRPVVDDPRGLLAADVVVVGHQPEIAR
jgi:hypothetical protein